MPLTHPSVLRCASAVLTALLLAGCTGEVSPAPTAPATSAAAPTTSATPPASTPAPAAPVDLTTPGKVGSQAAVRHFFALYAHLTATGTPGAFEDLTAESCDYCSEVVSETVGVYEWGGRIEGDVPSITSIEFDENRSTPNRHVWNTTLDITAVTVFNKDGGVEYSDGGTSTALGVVASWGGDAWAISTVVEAAVA